MQNEVSQLDPVSGSARALVLLEILAEDPGLSAASIARRSGMAKSTTHHVLSVMRDLGFAWYDSGRRVWSPGPRAAALGISHPSVAQVFAVLESFDQGHHELAVEEVASRSGLDTRAAARVLTELETERLALKIPDGRYALAYRVAAIASAVHHVERLRQAARDYLTYLRDQTGETANILMRDGNNAVYLDQVESLRTLRHAGWQGRAIPLAGSAAGAALTSDEGVYVVSDAVEQGVTAVACRIPGIEAPRAAVSVTAPSFRVKGPALSMIKTSVREAADRIGKELLSTYRDNGVTNDLEDTSTGSRRPPSP